MKEKDKKEKDKKEEGKKEEGKYLEIEVLIMQKYGKGVHCCRCRKLFCEC